MRLIKKIIHQVKSLVRLGNNRKRTPKRKRRKKARRTSRASRKINRKKKH